MSVLSPSAAATRPAVAAISAVPPWRQALVILGVALGLSCGFVALFNASLPFFLLPLGQEFGWGRGDTAAAAVLSMLGVSFASPFVGRLFDRFAPERVILVSVVSMAAGIAAMSLLPASLVALGLLCLTIGIVGSATTMIGYISVLPRWFDRRLGLALGLGGLGAALGVGLTPFVATGLIQAFGWRGAYAALGAIALGLGLLAFLLLRPGRGQVPPFAAGAGAGAAGALKRAAGGEGMEFKAALVDPRLWLLVAVTFVVPFAILGIALHGAALYLDRGLTAQQAAIGTSMAGLGAIGARVGVGALLDRFHAPRVAAIVFFAAGAGLLLGSSATSFAALSVGSFLCGAAMGAEGDLLPFMVRRYFGMRAFGAVFGTLHAAYALGGVIGPMAFGYTFDRLGSYSPLMLPTALMCVVCSLVVGWMGPYRFRAEPSTQT